MIPSYQHFMNPVLSICKDGRPYSVNELVLKSCQLLGIPEEQQQDVIPSGLQTVVKSRANWAAYYLKRAGCLTSSKRGVYQITERGKRLAEECAVVNSKFLEQFEEFLEFKKAGKSAEKVSQEVSLPQSNAEDTPDERIREAANELKMLLADELLEKIKTSVTPRHFEFIVADLLVAMGYGGGRKQSFVEVTRYANDEGIDGILKEDALGLELVCIQAKRYKDISIGREAVQAFAGSLEGKRARKGVFITTSRFAKSAKEYVDKIEKKIVLIDGPQLAELMIDYEIGVTPQEKILIYRLDHDYFEDV